MSRFRSTLLCALLVGAWNALLLADDQGLISASEVTQRDASGNIKSILNTDYFVVGSPPEETARQFVNERIFDPTSTILSAEFVQVTRAPGGAHVRFQQLYFGIPVYRGEIVVSLDNSNVVRMATSSAVINLALRSTVPSLTPGQALGRARSILSTGSTSIGKDDGCMLMVYKETAMPRLVYRVTMTRENPPGDWEIVIDAATGEVINVEDLFVTRSPWVQGRGYVYQSDPLSKSRRVYNNTGFTDANDADSDSLNACRSLVALDSLTYENGLYILRGPYVSITDIESPPDPTFYTAASPDSFLFSRSQQGFEAVNAYYHASKAYQRLLELGFDNRRLRNLRIDPHGVHGMDNSHYSPEGNWIALGEGGIDDGEDADVILHEYGHAINYCFSPGWGGGECGALGEGYADYWAMSFSRALNEWQSSDMQYHWLFNWDGHNPFWIGRNVNDPRTYPFNNLPIHSAGQIWATALMGMQEDLGRDVTDRLVLKSLLYLGSCATAEQASHAMIQADRDLFNGTHVQIIVHWLGTVKRFITPSHYVPVISHTPPSGIQSAHQPIRIVASISSHSGLNPNDVWLNWRIRDGKEESIRLEETADPFQFEGHLPAQNVSDTISYYITARDSSGSTGSAPRNAPTSVYRLVTRTASDVLTSTIPDDFLLGQNYPNPFNPTTTIRFDLPVSSMVSLTIFDVVGRHVETLIDGLLPAGGHTAAWDPGSRGLSSGVYLYQMRAVGLESNASYIDLKKMIFLR